MKVTLYAFWRLERMEGTFRYLRRRDFAGDEEFHGRDGEPLLGGRISIGRMLSIGPSAMASLLEAAVAFGKRGRPLLPEHAKGRAAMAAIQQGRWQPSGEAQMPIELAAGTSEHLPALRAEHRPA